MALNSSNSSNLEGVNSANFTTIQKHDLWYITRCSSVKCTISRPKVCLFTSATKRHQTYDSLHIL